MRSDFVVGAGSFASAWPRLLYSKRSTAEDRKPLIWVAPAALLPAQKRATIRYLIGFKNFLSIENIFSLQARTKSARVAS
jgi:hypothetical protein